ncbi:preprotein translocase subunit SecE [Anaerosalibacter massiliensis]|uniref:Protein translocase subunit SecE n=1 Tax=Anaerosalibacter massiliensis TaxID=1347392 RepID=A0A9X2MM22_9FIRM|nr:preprotein translocase subunit SecE [Anaerosalibacter massiliensis]MCR2045627.1 preprotein translocase subunit SecE [Anaerosalibacter massiliensis]
MSAQTSSKKGKVGTYFKGVKAETKKVMWPTKKETIDYIGVVIFMCLVFGLVVWVLDLGIHRLLSFIIK